MSETGVWLVLRDLVARVSRALQDEGLSAAAIKDLSSALAQVAKVEIQASLVHRSPGRPPKDKGAAFGDDDILSELSDLEEPSDG